MDSKTSQNADQDQINQGSVPVSDKAPSTNADSLPRSEPSKKPATSWPTNPGAGPKQIATVVNIYRTELGDFFEGLKRRSIKIQEKGQRFIKNANTIKQNVISTITATTDIRTHPLAIVHTFGWATVLLFGFSVSSILGAYVFSSLIGVFVAKLGAALIAAIGIPIYGYYMVKKDERDVTYLLDSHARSCLLKLALVQGLLTGFVLSETYVSAHPVTFLFPATIAIVYPLVHPFLGTNRINLLKSSIGAAFAINLVAGFLTGSLTTVYLLMIILYSAASAIIMQFIFRNVFSKEHRVHLYQLALLSTFVAVKLGDREEENSSWVKKGVHFMKSCWYRKPIVTTPDNCIMAFRTVSNPDSWLELLHFAVAYARLHKWHGASFGGFVDVYRYYRPSKYSKAAAKKKFVATNDTGKKCINFLLFRKKGVPCHVVVALYNPFDSSVVIYESQVTRKTVDDDYLADIHRYHGHSGSTLQVAYAEGYPHQRDRYSRCFRSLWGCICLLAKVDPCDYDMVGNGPDDEFNLGGIFRMAKDLIEDNGRRAKDLSIHQILARVARKKTRKQQK